MDDYTKRSLIYRNERFGKTDESGVYYAHQPIYGLRGGPSDRSQVFRYVITYNVLRAMAHLEFHSLMDIGGAEGYKSYLVSEFFDKDVFNSDLSDEGCKRAAEIFNVNSFSADIHNIPLKDHSCDVVLCSETLEHVSDWRRAVSELLRVAAKAVVISVPFNEPEAFIEANKKRGKGNPHVNSFNDDTFDVFLDQDIEAKTFHFMWKPLRVPATLVDASYREHRERDNFPRLFSGLYNRCVPVLRKLLGPRAASLILNLDSMISRSISYSDGLIVVLLKDKKCWIEKPERIVKAADLLRFNVPYHYLAK